MPNRQLQSGMTASWLENPGARNLLLQSDQLRQEILIFRAAELPHDRPISLNYCLQGENANLQLLIVFLDNGEKSARPDCEIRLQIEHRAPHTSAKVSLRALLNGRHNLNFPASIFVPATAILTDTHLSCDCLMLGPGSSFRPIPALEILANEVKAGHAASCSPPDEESLFFLQARGLSDKEAKSLMIESFLSSGLAGLELAGGKEHLQLEKKIAGLAGDIVV